MDIPVYLIAGFLDGGKTNFINSLLADGFADEDKTLIICCEQGEEEYNRKLLTNVFTEPVDDPAVLTPGFFKKMEKLYRPKQVLIEYNGMWPMEPLLQGGLPYNWMLYQVMVFIEAGTFETYRKNMGQLMMEKVMNADLIIFNRCNAELREKLRELNLRVANRTAEIYLENSDGTSENYVTDDMVPFEIKDNHLDVADDDFGVWYVDLMDKPERYDGVEVHFKAQMCHTPQYPGVHCPGRFAMVCCENDMQFLALVCKGEGMEQFENRDWVEIEATVKKEHSDAYEGEGPVLYVSSVRGCEKPEEVNVTV